MNSDAERVALVDDSSNISNENEQHEFADNTNTKNISTKKAVQYLIIASIGTTIEWFDFAIFSSLTTQIGHNFFPSSQTESMKLLESFSLFGVSFIVRPFGGLLFGYIGDKYGRVTSLRLSILLMAFPTLFIALLPTYHSIGFTATILLLILRILQGLSVGGELTTTLVYVLEICPNQHKSLFLSFVQSLSMGVIPASLIMSILMTTLTSNEMDDFGWRIPFFLSFLVVIFGLYIRRCLPETNEFTEINNRNPINPMTEILKSHKLKCFSIFLHYFLNSFMYYMLWIWLPIYLTTIKTVNPIKSAFLLNAVACIITSIARCFSGYLGDVCSPIKVILGFGPFCLIIQIFVLPMLFDSNELETWIIVCGLGALYAMSVGPIDIFILNNLKEPEIRNSIFGLSYNLSVACIASITPLLCTVFTSQTGENGLRYVALFAVALGTISYGTDVIVQINKS